MDRSLARQTWQLLEPYHAVVYFAPAAKPTYESVGLKGYWMGYFASRSAAMGPVGPEVVTATFYNFHPRMVQRAIPDAWKLSTPQQVLAARYEVADNSLRRCLSNMSGPNIAEGAAIAREIASYCTPQGRPLFAAHASLPWPEDPHLVLWHAATLWREFRGDGHIAALMVEQIDGCEAHVLAAAAGVLPEGQREHRGWSDEEWIDAATRLRQRGLVDEEDRLTGEGQATRDRIERLTDELSLPPLAMVGQNAITTLHSVLQPVCEQIVEANGLPYPNAMGLTAPVAAAVGGSNRPEIGPDGGG